ncbi:MAG: hemolysin III family protein [Acidimicrobiales bacterium]
MVETELNRPRRTTHRRQRPSGSAESPRGRGLIHLGALVVALPASVVLVCRDGVGGGVGLYALALVGLYAVSAGYHLLPWSPAARRRARKADHAMIYVFIAACFTPYCLLGVPGTVSLVVLGLGWFGVAAAVVTIAIRFEATLRLTSWAYLLVGWLPAVTLPAAIHDLSTTQFILVGSMGLLYSAGAGVLAVRWPDPVPEVFGYHEVWHSIVVVASACYFAVVWSFAAPH